MMFVIRQDCKCCMMPRRDFWHCEDCWDRFHNGKADKDWMNEDEWVSSGHAQEFMEIREAYDKDIENLVSKMIDEAKFCRHKHRILLESAWKCPECGEQGLL